MRKFEYNRTDLKDHAPGLYDLPEDAVFLDIETTGLSAASASLYLIGAAFFEGNLLHTCQWFADSFLDERALLLALSEFLETKKALVTYNGEAFDLRFLSDCARTYGLPAPWESLDHLDLMKVSRRSKKLSGLSSFRQKSVEAFLGISREDAYSGGELIAVYERYLHDRNEDDLNALLLHNREDVDGLPALLPMLSLEQLTGHPVFRDLAVEEPSSDPCLRIRGTLEPAFPVPLTHAFSNGTVLNVEKGLFSLSVPAFEGTLRLYFPNYREYAFLPLEGYAVHNDLATFIDRSRKCPATRETAFTLETGVFLPAPSSSSSMILYREDYRSKMSYIRLSDLNPELYLNELWTELQ